MSEYALPPDASVDAKLADISRHDLPAVTIAEPGAPAEVVLKVDGNEFARVTVKRTVPAAFTAADLPFHLSVGRICLVT